MSDALLREYLTDSCMVHSVSESAHHARVPPVTLLSVSSLPEYLVLELTSHNGAIVLKEMSTFPTDKEKTSLHEVRDFFRASVISNSLQIRLLFDSLDVQGDVVSGYTLSGNRVTINCKDRQIAESLMLKFAGQVEPVRG